MELELLNYDRKPFHVVTVQVTPQNAEAVAEWCGGKVVTVPTRMIGATVDMPAVELKAANGKKAEVAEIGHWIVERKGTHRAYKPQAFGATFVRREEKVEPTVGPPPSEDELVADVNT
jgi:hypothetical protein